MGRHKAGYHERRHRIRIRWLNWIKQHTGCVDCGYNAHPSALEFDHLPGAIKSFTISGRTLGNADRIRAEIAKCEVVCANCHRVRTAERRG